jgi:DNA-binding transcriptional regulator YdaS (Cro superfamily)
MDSGLRAAIKAAGTKYRLAKSIGIRPQTVQRWRRIPAERVLEIETALLIDREVLRSDLYGHAKPKGLK